MAFTRPKAAKPNKPAKVPGASQRQNPGGKGTRPPAKPARPSEGRPRNPGNAKGVSRTVRPGPAKATPSQRTAGIKASATNPAVKAAVNAGKPPPPTPGPQDLTAAQQLALSAWNTKYSTTLAADQRKLGNAQAAYKVNTQTAQHNSAESTDMANQALAARGMGFSSIRDNALNDITLALTQRDNLLTTNLNTLTVDTNSAIATLNSDNAGEQTYYAGLEAAGAGAVPVTPGQYATGTVPAAPAPAATPAQPAPKPAPAPVTPPVGTAGVTTAQQPGSTPNAMIPPVKPPAAAQSAAKSVGIKMPSTNAITGAQQAGSVVNPHG